MAEGQRRIREGGIRYAVPYVPQSLDFTCGAACLLMALGAFHPRRSLTREEELDIWREANLVELWGTSRFGLALAAARRGYRAATQANLAGPGFVSALVPTVPHVDRRVLQFFFDDLRSRCKQKGIPDRRGAVGRRALQRALQRGRLPIFLSDAQAWGEKRSVPHWLIATGWDERGLWVHNPSGGLHGRDLLLPWPRLRAARGFCGDECLVEIWKPGRPLPRVPLLKGKDKAVLRSS